RDAHMNRDVSEVIAENVKTTESLVQREGERDHRAPGGWRVRSGPENPALRLKRWLADNRILIVEDEGPGKDVAVADDSREDDQDGVKPDRPRWVRGRSGPRRMRTPTGWHAHWCNRRSAPPRRVLISFRSD